MTDYPASFKSFYMYLNDDGKTVRAMDVLVPRIGELIGGSQREDRLDVLKERIAHHDLDEKDYWWYLNLREFGTVPHAGFGLGFERLVMYVTGLSNIRDVISFPRTPKHAEFNHHRFVRPTASILLEDIKMYVTGLSNLRDIISFPRAPKSR